MQSVPIGAADRKIIIRCEILLVLDAHSSDTDYNLYTYCSWGNICRLFYSILHYARKKRAGEGWYVPEMIIKKIFYL